MHNLQQSTSGKDNYELRALQPLHLERVANYFGLSVCSGTRVTAPLHDPAGKVLGCTCVDSNKLVNPKMPAALKEQLGFYNLHRLNRNTRVLQIVPYVQLVWVLASRYPRDPGLACGSAIATVSEHCSESQLKLLGTNDTLRRAKLLQVLVPRNVWGDQLAARLFLHFGSSRVVQYVPFSNSSDLLNDPKTDELLSAAEMFLD